MNTVKPNNRVFITVKRKTGTFKSVPVWNRVMMDLQGDVSDLQNLTKELQEVKSFVNTEMNRKGYALKDVKVTIEFAGDKE